jgi:uncharacterized membrane protein
MASDTQRKSRSMASGRARLGTVLYMVAALVSLLGLADATYLTVQFLTGEAAVCGGSANCFQVLGSAYARIGRMPIAGFGVVAYFIAFTCATFAAFGYAQVRKFFTVTVWAMFAVTLWLLFVQAFLLHAFCRYCLLSAALVFVLAALVILKRASA